MYYIPSLEYLAWLDIFANTYSLMHAKTVSVLLWVFTESTSDLLIIATICNACLKEKKVLCTKSLQS